MSNLKKLYALVAQLDRVFGYEPKGRGFESRRAYQKKAHIVYQDNVCFFQRNPPSSEEIHLQWMKSLRDEIPLTRG